MFPLANHLVQVDDVEAIREQRHHHHQGQVYIEEWREQKLSLLQLPANYLKLSKYRLTGTYHDRIALCNSAGMIYGATIVTRYSCFK